MNPSASDSELLEGLRENRPGAFDRFVDRYGERIYGLGLRFCGEREDARDVAQETLLQAFRSLKSWLYRVASNACLMKRRKGKYEPVREISLDDLLPADPGEASLEIAAPGDLPDESVERLEARELVREAVRDLPPHYRIVVILRDMEHLSTREVAQVLDLPETTVKMRLHRGRLMVRRRLVERLPAGDVS